MLSTLSSRSSRSGFDRLLGENCTRASSAWRGREQRDGSPLSFAQPAGAEQQRQRRRWHESDINLNVASRIWALAGATFLPCSASRSDLDTSLDAGQGADMASPTEYSKSTSHVLPVRPARPSPPARQPHLFPFHPPTKR